MVGTVPTVPEEPAGSPDQVNVTFLDNEQLGITYSA